MTQYKEFQGKSLDEAIEEACSYYGVAREKLEIEIVNDAQGGIFGLMGMKKASIKAARMQLGEPLSADIDDEEDEDDCRGNRIDDVPAKPRVEKSQEKSRTDKTGQKAKQQRGSRGSTQRSGTADDEKTPSSRSKAEESSAKATREKTPRTAAAPKRSAAGGNGNIAPASSKSTAAKKAAPQNANEADEANGRESLPDFNYETGDLNALTDIAKTVVLRLAEPIVGNVPCEIEIGGKRVRAVLDCGDAAGLLVGRDGQTLASLQYIASRIIARQLGASVRLQIDAGRYRERQDDKLRELALSLAEKAKQSGRVQSTRPLSAYQRRIVHLALEHDPQVHTRSKGDGAQRRVLILLSRETEKEAHTALGEEHEASNAATTIDSPDDKGDALS